MGKYNRNDSVVGIILVRNTQHPVMLHYKVTPKGVIEALREVGEPNSTLMDEQQKRPDYLFLI